MINRALVLTRFGGADALQPSTLPVPEATPGFVVVRVNAVGLNAMDWKMREGFLKDVIPTVFPSVLGVELAGEVHATSGTSRFSVGDRVFALVAPGHGAFADYVLLPESTLVATPASVPDIVAAALPVAALTASQMLAAAGTPRAGQTVLVHGAAGGVGTLLVQMAKQLGLTVIATASATGRQHLLDLGVDTVIDRNTERFEDVAGEVDIVIDLVGADAPDRSWPLLRDGGVLVSAVRFDVAAPRADGKRGVALMLRPDNDRLAQVAEAVAAGALSVTICETVPLADLSAALERNRLGHGPGKAVVDFTRA